MTTDEQSSSSGELEPNVAQLGVRLAAECRNLTTWVALAGEEDQSHGLGTFYHVRKGRKELTDRVAAVEAALQASRRAGDSRKAALALVADGVRDIKLAPGWDGERDVLHTRHNGCIWCDRDGPEPYGHVVAPEDAVIGYVSVDALQRAVMLLGLDEPSQAMAGASGTKPVPEMPPLEAFHAWSLYGVLQNQRKVAEKLWRDPKKQYKVSRYLDEVREYLAAGGVPPDIADRKRRAARKTTVDPSMIDMGKRQDSVTPRQRSRRDPSSTDGVED